MDHLKKNESNSFLSMLKFLVPSVLGVLILMFPIKYDEGTTIAVALLANKLTSYLEAILPTVVLLLIGATALLTAIYKISKPAFIENRQFLKNLCNVSAFWLIARIVGFILCLLVYLQLGPEWIWSENTGGLILYDLILSLFSIFLFAGFFLPLLTDFGLLEFVGVMVTPLMRPVFTLPGRSAIDCVASWVGDGTIGVILTDRQYEQGYYTAREASVIATTFSAVSITFCLVVLNQVGLTKYFGIYYLTVALAGIVAAIIMPRIPPLSRKKDTYYQGVKMDKGENVPEGYSLLKWGLTLAVKKAEDNISLKKFFKNGAKTVFDMWFGVLPSIMAFGTIALIIAEFTPVFQWLGVPFIPLFKLLNIPYATEASQTVMVGFADMFLPAVIGASIPSEMTRFVVASLSVTQLVYLSEVGAVVLGAKVPVDLKDLFIIFIERTLITLPVIAIIAHLIF